MDAETVASIFSAREEYLNGAFKAIEDQCGTVQKYLNEVLDLDDRALARLRSVCLA